MANSLVGFITGSIGRDPFDRRSWSGSSYFLFSGLRKRGLLHRAFSVEVRQPKRFLYMAKNFRPQRQVWRKRFYSDPHYRRSLTEELRRNLGPGDAGHPVFQLGAMCDAPRAVGGRTACYSFHDSNLAESARSPYLGRTFTPRELDRALAFERQVYHGTDRLFSGSEYMRQSFIKNYDVPPERVVTVGLGINLDQVPEPPQGKRYDGAELLFIGGDFARKGGWELLRAFRAVRGHERFAHARLHLVGPRQLSIPAELSAGVEYHGFLNKQTPADKARLDELFRRASLFVMPSLYEPFGIAPLEAMVHEIPAVVTNRWALPELVTPGQTGELVECGSVDDLVSKLSRLLDDPEGLRRMGEAGRRTVLEKFTWDKVVDRVAAALPG